MGRGSYDNSPKLGLTGQRDDGAALKLRRAAGLHPRTRLDAGWEFGRLLTDSKSFAGNMVSVRFTAEHHQGIEPAHRVSIP